MLAVGRLSKRFGSTLAVDQLSFHTSPGPILGFLGPNGAGKTTTLRALLGLTLPTSGTATVDGRSYRELRDATRIVGAVLEGPQFHPGRTGRNHLRVLATAAGLPPSRADDVPRRQCRSRRPCPPRPRETRQTLEDVFLELTGRTEAGR